MAFDNNGIINMTKNATSMYSESQEKDKVAVKELSNSMKEKIKRNSSESGDQEQEEEIKYYNCQVSIPYTQILNNAPKDVADEKFNYIFRPIDGSPSPNESNNNGCYTFAVKGNEENNLNLTFENLEANKWYSYEVLAYEKKPRTGFVPDSRTYTVKFQIEDGNKDPAILIMISGHKYYRLEFEVSYTAAPQPTTSRPTT